MKKKYETPAMKIVRLNTERMIAQSAMRSSYGMGYGGVDTSGGGTPM